MPRSCSIRRGHNHRDATYNETHNSHCETKIFSKGKAPKSHPVMNEIACPYSQCIKGKHPFVLHTLQREDTLLHLAHHVFNFRHEGKATHQHPEEHDRDDQANGCHNIARSGETTQYIMNVRARTVKERHEDSHLRKDDD